MNGASPGLSSCVNSTPGSPQPHHFIAGRGDRALASRAGVVAVIASS